MISILKALGKNPSKGEAKKMLDEYDSDKNGTIEFNEFLNLYKERF
jgi:Ca2+-binding EF-hand superfamily protein